MSKIINRKDAFARRLIRYFTGKPCKHGHIAERRTDTGNCTECQWLAQQRPERMAANRLYKRLRRAGGNADVSRGSHSTRREVVPEHGP
jgi:hypothetical protein